MGRTAAGARRQARRPVLAEGGGDRPLRLVLDRPQDASARGLFAYLVWDDEALYYAGTMTDAELRSYGKQAERHASGTATSSSCSSSPTREHPGYYEFQANPRALVFEMAFPRRGQLSPAISPRRRSLGNKAVVLLNGTLDQPGDRDEGWTVEGRIPWSAFRRPAASRSRATSGSSPSADTTYGPEGTKPILMSSAPLTEPNFHRHEDYGKLRFEGPREKTKTPGNP